MNSQCKQAFVLFIKISGASVWYLSCEARLISLRSETFDNWVQTQNLSQASVTFFSCLG